MKVSWFNNAVVFLLPYLAPLVIHYVAVSMTVICGD